MGLFPELCWNIKGKRKSDKKQGQVRAPKRIQNGFHVENANPRDKKKIEMYFTSVIKMCLKNRFQLCKAKEWHKENSCFFSIEGENPVTDGIETEIFK